MRVRYKSTGSEASSSRFNIHSLTEVLTEDDSPDIGDLDVFVNDAWKDMRQAFRDKDIVPDNYNERFGLPVDEAAKIRGYNP